MKCILNTLIIDDSPQDALLLTHALRSNDIELQTRRVCTASELELCLTESPWDIIVCDYEMPALTAEAAMDICRALAVDTPLIVVSGAISDERAVALLKAGAYDFVRKDNLVRLLPAVKRAMEDAATRKSRVQSEIALRESEQFLTTLIEHIPNMIFVKDARELRLVRMNRAGEELLGLSGAELYGKNDYDLFPKDEADFFIRKDRETLDAGLVVDIPEERIHTKYKGERILHTKKIPIFDNSGTPVYLLGISEDITESKRIDEHLRHVDKMQALGTLAGGVAHDFNNILTAIMGFADMVMNRMGAENPSFAHLQQIVRAGEQAATLTRGLLAYSRREVMKSEAVDLNDIVPTSIRLLRRLIREDISLATSMQSGKLIFRGDRGQIEQILMNLATNARDAMPEGGALLITTEMVKLDQKFIDCHGSGEAGPYALLTVSDTGTGMDEAACRRAIEPFFTTKETGKGTGLGLAIVHGIVMQHKGLMEILSEPGKGTAIRIYLPIDGMQERAAETSEETVQEAAPGGTETILLVEDNPQVKDLLSYILEENGYTVVAASNGKEALDVMARISGNVSLAIIDVIMPGKNGREVFAELKQIYPALTALFISGYPQDIVSGKGILDAGTDFMAKPIVPSTLLIKVRGMLDRRSGQGV